jgi:hypothetical protein
VWSPLIPIAIGAKKRAGILGSATRIREII